MSAPMCRLPMTVIAGSCSAPPAAASPTQVAAASSPAKTAAITRQAIPYNSPIRQVNSSKAEGGSVSDWVEMGGIVGAPATKVYVARAWPGNTEIPGATRSAGNAAFRSLCRAAAQAMAQAATAAAFTIIALVDIEEGRVPVRLRHCHHGALVGART